MRKFNLVLIFVSIISIDAFSTEKVKEKFKIYGNCGMCNEVITKAAKSVDGVIYLKWNSKTKIAKHTLKYSPLIFIEYFEPSCAPTTPPKSNNIAKIRSTL